MRCLCVVCDRNRSEQDETNDSLQFIKLFVLWGYYALIAPLEIALAQQDVDESFALLKSILAAALSPWNVNDSALYCHISSGMKQEAVGLILNLSIIYIVNGYGVIKLYICIALIKTHYSITV